MKNSITVFNIDEHFYIWKFTKGFREHWIHYLSRDKVWSSIIVWSCNFWRNSTSRSPTVKLATVQTYSPEAVKLALIIFNICRWSPYALEISNRPLPTILTPSRYHWTGISLSVRVERILDISHWNVTVSRSIVWISSSNWVNVI
jgi:hypothetical protein